MQQVCERPFQKGRGVVSRPAIILSLPWIEIMCFLAHGILAVLNKRQFYISMRHGDIRDRELLLKILQGPTGEEEGHKHTDSTDSESTNQE